MAVLSDLFGVVFAPANQSKPVVAITPILLFRRLGCKLLFDAAVHNVHFSFCGECLQKEVDFLKTNPAVRANSMANGMMNNVMLLLARLVRRALPATQVGEFVNRLIHDKTHYRGRERRRCPRYPLAESVSAIPLDDHLQATGPPFDAVTRDISACGVSIISHTRCEGKYLSLLLVNSSSDYLEVVIRVARFRVVGPMYEYAGPFIPVLERLKQTNQTPAPNLEALADG